MERLAGTYHPPAFLTTFQARQIPNIFSALTVGSLLFILLAYTLSTSSGAPDRHLLRMEDLLKAGFDRHLVRLYRPGSWGLGPRRGRRSPGGGQQKFETTPKAELYSRGVADTEDVRFLLPVDDARPKSGKCGSQAQPYTPPSYNRAPRIRNGTCTPYGAFPWTVQIQVEYIPTKNSISIKKTFR